MARTWTAWLGASAVAVALVAGPACSAYRPLASERALPGSAGYRAALENASRRGKAGSEVNVQSHLDATLLTPAFRDAFRAEWHDAYGPGVTIPEEMRPGRATFVIALTSDSRDLRAPSGYGALWTLTAQVDGRVFEPDSVLPLTQEDEFYRRFFPYWTPWRRMYRAEFPLPASTTAVRLTFRSVAGSAQLDW